MVTRCSYGYGGDTGAAADDFDQAPTFGFGEWPSFFDADVVAHFGFALLIVGIEFLIAGNDFPVFRMGKSPFDPDDDGFGHLVRDDLASALFTLAAIQFQSLCCFSHVQIPGE